MKTTNHFVKKHSAIALFIWSLFMGSSLNCIGQALLGEGIIYNQDFIVLNNDPKNPAFKNVNAGVKMRNENNAWSMYNSNDNLLRFSYGSNNTPETGDLRMILGWDGSLALYSQNTSNPSIRIAKGGKNLRITHKDDATTNNIGYIGFANGQDNFFAYSNSNTQDFIVPNGKIGIGTTTPSEKLEVNGTIKATAIKFADGTTLSTAPTAPNSPWQTSGTNIYTVQSLNVGIGTTAPPTAKLEIGADDASITRTMLKVHGGATFNNDGPDDTDKAKTTQVSINTNKKIKNAALTVAGVTFIGAWGELETLDSAVENNSEDDVVNGTINDENYDNFNLWVTKGIVSEDYAITKKKDWADHVFRDEYKLATLNEVAAFIKENKHLPGLISEKEVKEKGYNLHNVNRSFLEKIENLYLYSIAQEKALKLQQEKINTQEEKINTQEEKINTQEEKINRMEQGFSELKAAFEKVNQQK